MVRRTTTTETVATTEPVVEERVAPGFKFEQLVWFLLALIGALLLVRFVLLLFGARSGVPFVDLWYAISAPLVAPFAGIFGNDTYNLYTGSRFESESLVAMLVYSLVAYLLVLAIRLVTPNTPRKELK